MIDPAALIGTTRSVTVGQECVRAAIILIYGLLLVRLGGRRIFGKWAALDFIVSVIVGSSLSRALTGSAPFLGTLAATAVLVLLHGLLGKLVSRSSTLSHWVEGVPIVIARDGEMIEKSRVGQSLSEADVNEAIRKNGLKTVDGASEIVLEPSGTLNVLKR